MTTLFKNYYWTVSFCILFASCQSNEKTTNKTSVIAKDSVKTDSLKQAADTVKTVPPLTGEAAKFVKNWKAESVEMKNGVKLTGDIIDLRFSFKNDLSFDFSEDSKSDNGTWKLSEDGKTLELAYKSSAHSKLKVKEIGEDKLVLAGKEHGLERTYVLKAVK